MSGRELSAKAVIEPAGIARDLSIEDAAHLLAAVQELSAAHDLPAVMQAVRRWARELTLLQSLANATSIALASAELFLDLGRERDRFRQLTEAVPQLVWTARPEGDARYFNRRWCEYTGLSVEESLGDRWRDAMHPHDLPGLLERWRAACPIEIAVPAEPVLANGDRIRLGQALGNLLANALKYGAGQPVALALETTGRVACLRVTDRGIGISAEDQTRIFSRFERAVPIRNYGGLGLGLFLAHRILLAHGGALRVDSRVGEGATLTMELLLAPGSGAMAPDDREEA